MLRLVHTVFGIISRRTANFQHNLACTFLIYTFVFLKFLHLSNKKSDKSGDRKSIKIIVEYMQVVNILLTSLIFSFEKVVLQFKALMRMTFKEAMAERMLCAVCKSNLGILYFMRQNRFWFT